MEEEVGIQVESQDWESNEVTMRRVVDERRRKPELELEPKERGRERCGKPKRW